MRTSMTAEGDSYIYCIHARDVQSLSGASQTCPKVLCIACIWHGIANAPFQLLDHKRHHTLHINKDTLTMYRNRQQHI